MQGSDITSNTRETSSKMTNYIILFVLAVLVPNVPANPVDDVCQRQVRSKLTEIQSIKTEIAKLMRICESAAFEDCCQVSLFSSILYSMCIVIMFHGAILCNTLSTRLEELHSEHGTIKFFNIGAPQK